MLLKDYISGIQHIGIPTVDLHETIDFYKMLGFEQRGVFKNGNSMCAFLELNAIIIETWTVNSTSRMAGAINHISLDTTDANQAMYEAQQLGLTIAESKIQTITTFWEKGIRYFSIIGPNQEIIELCEIIK